MFVRGGYVNPGNGLSFAGNAGHYWSSVSYDSNEAYDLGFTPYAVTPSNDFRRYFGPSIRCVALGD